MSTHYQGPSEEVRALGTFIKFSRAYNSLTTHMKQHLDSYGLTPSQFGTLESLYHLGPMSQKDIGNKILKSSGNMTMVIDNLVKQKLVRRERDQEDRRQYFIHLTQQGKELIKDVFPKHAALITRAFSKLTAEEQEEFGRIAKILGDQSYIK